MDKPTLLSAITQLSSQNLLSKNEIVQAFDKGKGQHKNALLKDIGIAEVLYFIGGFIVFIGISVLIFQNWTSLSTITKILATFGFGLVSYFVGVLLNKEEKYGALGFAFHLIAALVLPLGLGVIFDQSGYDATSSGLQSFIAGILVVMYGVSYMIFKKTIFTFFGIVYATWLFFSFTNFLVGGNPLFLDAKFYEYRFFVVGLSYIFTGYYLSMTSQKELTGPLYGFGIFFALGAALALGGWKPSQNIFWELMFPLLVSLVFYLSVQLKSKSFLTFGTIYLMIYILKITGEYFSGTLGWPLSLILSGISLIGIGYYAFTLNKKYITTTA